MFPSRESKQKIQTLKFNNAVIEPSACLFSFPKKYFQEQVTFFYPLVNFRKRMKGQSMQALLSSKGYPKISGFIMVLEY